MGDLVVTLLQLLTEFIKITQQTAPLVFYKNECGIKLIFKNTILEVVIKIPENSFKEVLCFSKN